MALFNQTKTVAQSPAAKYASARSNLLIAIAFTLANIILLVVDADLYFLFSAYLPYTLVLYMKVFCGMMPDEYYEGVEMEFLPESAFYVSLAIAAVILIVYFICWIFSNKNRYGFLIAALVLFAIDTVIMILNFDPSSFDIYTVIDVAFHAWVIYILVVGVMAGVSISKAPVTEVKAEFIPEAAAPEAPEAKLNGENADISEK
ncbi:MAG: hypothetical protein IKA51_02340 [Clostridia bacterium]|nr:hypothetical protein [Clostridia bacterium]